MGNNHKKYLGVDYGDFTIGLAIYDEKIDFTYPYKTIKRDKQNVIRKSLREIIDIVIKEGITDIVVGLPYNYDGTSGERVSIVENFVYMLKNKLTTLVKYEVPIHFQDERLTTVEAEEILDMNKMKRSEQKAVIDQVAAIIILKDFLEKL